MTSIQPFRYPIRTAEVWGFNDPLGGKKTDEDIASDMDYQDNAVEDYVSNISTTIGLTGNWTDYTPAITAQGGSPALGNGAIDCRSRTVGGLTVVKFALALGTTTNFGTGETYFSLPSTAKTPIVRTSIGTGSVFDSSTTTTYICDVVLISPYNIVALAPHGLANALSGGSGIPIAFAVPDVVAYTVAYEAA